MADIKVGLYGIGLDTYWPQFTGLLDRLTGYQQGIADRLSARHPASRWSTPGLSTTRWWREEIGDRLGREGVEIIFLFISTYALSSTVLPVVQRAGVPVVVLNLQPVAPSTTRPSTPWATAGTMTGVWLEHCQACCAAGDRLRLQPRRHRLPPGHRPPRG